jgi:aminoglycoside phosphotransferase (APT) family kinase protein
LGTINNMTVPAEVTRPSAKARNWAATAFGARARVTATKRLKGGISSAVHLLSIDDGHGHQHFVVLRRWNDSGHADGAAWVRREAHVLEQLAGVDIPAPRVLAIDPTGSSCGEAALLMTRLPGRMDLNPKSPQRWLEELVTMAVRIHGAQILAPEAESWLNRDSLIVPVWSKRPQLWRDAISLVNEAPPSDEHTFIHHDYQHFNLLWQRGRLSGIVDWVFGSIGSPGIDVGHCRLNLAVLYSSECAQLFLDLYERQSGRTVSAWWDVHELLVYLPGWGTFLQQQAGDQRTVDYAGMHNRVEETLASALRRV